MAIRTIRKKKNGVQVEESGLIQKEPIVFEHVVRGFDDNHVLQNVSFQIEPGSRVVLYGSSGSGKSTILRLMAGLLQPESGVVKMPADTSLSLVFQNDRLFDGISCFDNIAYGLNASSVSKEERADKVRHWARVFSCEDCLQQKTSTMSGGQRQRAALARAFMKEPGILLLDESFSSMDVVLKDKLMQQVLDLQKAMGFTMVFVTHNFEEARKMGDQLFLLKEGRVLQRGQTAQVMARPADLFEAQAFGGFAYNILPGSWLNHEGWAGISAYQCSISKQPGWIEISVQTKSEIPMGFCQLYQTEKQGTILYAASRQSGQNPKSVWLDPKGLVFFDENGTRINQTCNMKRP